MSSKWDFAYTLLYNFWWKDASFLLDPPPNWTHFCCNLQPDRTLGVVAPGKSFEPAVCGSFDYAVAIILYRSEKAKKHYCVITFSYTNKYTCNHDTLWYIAMVSRHTELASISFAIWRQNHRSLTSKPDEVSKRVIAYLFKSDRLPGVWCVSVYSIAGHLAPSFLPSALSSISVMQNLTFWL